MPRTPYRSPLGLAVRTYVAVALLALLLWLVAMAIATLMELDTLVAPIAVSVGAIALQYLLAPWIIGRTMRVREVDEVEEPDLCAAVRDMAYLAGIPAPRVGVSELPIPNAFAYGRSLKGGWVCVTRPLLGRLSDGELRAVIGHEIMHLRNRDVLAMSLLSVLPNVFYYVFRVGLRMRGRKSPGPAIALVGILAYFVAQLLVLFISRVREYAADRGSVALGNPPDRMASALYKLVYGAAGVESAEMAGAAGFKAFFASDPSKAHRELRDLIDLDMDDSGGVDRSEMAAFLASGVRPSFWQRIVELLSTHPNMILRIRRLAAMQEEPGGDGGAAGPA